ncbi:hypothetical protein KJ780_04655 [Candidatus Micrarchaeota archaeon]|nr:hypothetical protein [Candidatus Micrarchaeota archaeon]
MYSAMRLKKRYIVFQVKTPQPINPKEINDGLGLFLIRFFGEYGYSKLAFKLLQYDEKTKQGLIRCDRSVLYELLGSLSLIESLKEKKARLIPLASSGTIKTLREKGFKFIKEKE